MLKLIESSARLPLVDRESVEAYKANRNRLLERVNTNIKHHPSIQKFLTVGSMELLHNNHRNHFSFMSLVMMLNDYEMLARNLPWVYRAYHNQELIMIILWPNSNSGLMPFRKIWAPLKASRLLQFIAGC